MKLMCAIVGVPASAFSVEIDEDNTVEELKYAIKQAQMYLFPVNQMQLFLAKRSTREEEKGDDEEEWLTQGEELEGVSDTGGYRYLGPAGAKLRQVGLASGQVGDTEAAAGMRPVHVLVGGSGAGSFWPAGCPQ
ncbi:hypothetical protein PR001_g21792 [Phytophthora rubi]|uniref:Crinkler effector protein N-terminal domain-containing protein n=1 Tax=Phytophthora rubi TaxID=129364 RepID=A0A6A3J6I7_9STRA|nr:hypothetical protein PR001_g21792 [Phytophthora rubi]